MRSEERTRLLCLVTAHAARRQPEKKMMCKGQTHLRFYEPFNDGMMCEFNNFTVCHIVFNWLKASMELIGLCYFLLLSAVASVFLQLLHWTATVDTSSRRWLHNCLFPFFTASFVHGFDSTHGKMSSMCHWLLEWNVIGKERENCHCSDRKIFGFP